MPVLDLQNAKPIEGYAPRAQQPKRSARRTFGDSGTVPAGLLSGRNGNGRGFAGAKIDRLTRDFITSQNSADSDLYGDNVRLRTRARKLAGDNPLAKNFLFKVAQNVVGAHGIAMVPKVVSSNGKETAETTAANKRIAEEWHRFTHSRRCSADGKFNLTSLAHLAVKNVAREGENITKLVYGRSFSDYGIAFQTLDNDQLDDTLMIGQAGDGNQIRMGVEVDQYGRPQGYHLFSSHPYDMLGTQRERKRVPAAEVIHTAMWERPGQTRGYTWLAASMKSLNQYDRYEEAVIVASRSAAAKFGVIEQQLGDEWADDEDEDTEEDQPGGQPDTVDFETGEFMTLAPGQSFKWNDPRFPTTTHREFTQTVLRVIASGLLVQYPLLANDLEGVNFSSIRAGMVDERDMWRILQKWFIDTWYMPLYQAWLRISLLTRLKDINLTDDQMEQVEWMPRGFDWVDPAKDADAVILKLGEGLTTLESECAAVGRDWKQIVDQRAKEMEYCKQKKVVFGVDLTGDQAGKGVAADDEDEAAAAQGSTQK